MDNFVTKDLYLASYLKSSGCELISCAQVNGISMFSFVRSEKLDKLIHSYFSPEASVHPLKYDEAMKALRSLAMGPKQKKCSIRQSACIETSAVFPKALVPI